MNRDIYDIHRYTRQNVKINSIYVDIFTLPDVSLPSFFRLLFEIIKDIVQNALMPCRRESCDFIERIGNFAFADSTAPLEALC